MAGLTFKAPIPQNGQTHDKLPTNCLSVFGNFVKLALKGLKNKCFAEFPFHFEKLVLSEKQIDGIIQFLIL